MRTTIPDSSLSESLVSLGFDKPSLVIFDCDGVLVDSEPTSCAVTADLLTLSGCRISAVDVQTQFLGMSVETMRRSVESRLGIMLPPDFADRLNENFIQRISRLSPVQDVEKLLEDINVASCVASSSAPSRLEMSLAATKLDRFFGPHVYSASMVSRGKPAPDLFLFAAREMGCPTATTIVVEDSVAGIEAANAAGMLPIGFIGGSHCGSGHGQLLREAGAPLIVQNHRELRTLLCPYPDEYRSHV